MAPNTPLNVITPNKPMNIVIIGGSNTGLMNGIVLKRLRHNVHILEQNTKSERSDLAAGITTHPEFDEFMDVHDLVKQPWCVQSPGIQWLNKVAAVTREAKRPLKMTSWGVIYHRLRGNFDGFTSSFCPNPPTIGEKDGNATFDLGKRVTGLSDVEHGVQVAFEDLLDGNKPGSLSADLVILADGANSGLRGTLFPDVERVYAGYVAFRGVVPEEEVSAAAKEAFDPKLSYFCFKNNYILLYIIPGADGSLEPGHRRYNWVWYHPLAADSQAFTEIMTDNTGTLHRNTLPVGGMNLETWSKYVKIATEQMCTPFADVIEKTTQPFITAISDLACPRAVAMNGRVLVTGEALNLVRPHMALSTTASANQAQLLEKAFRGEMTVEQWEKKVLHDGRLSALKTNAFGTYFLYGPLSAIGWVAKLVGAMLGGMLSFSSLPAVPHPKAVPGKTQPDADYEAKKTA